MKQGVTAFRRAAFLIAVVFCIGAALTARARASVFCPADVAFMTPWDFSKDAPAAGDTALQYLFTLSGDEPETVSGDLIVVTDTKAFTVPFSDLQIVRSIDDPQDFASDSTFLALPQRDAVRYAWVDDVTDSSGKHTSCPTLPYHLEPLDAGMRAELTPENAHPMQGPYAVQSLQAHYKMDLPPLTCPKTYSGPVELAHISQTEGFYDPSVVKNPTVEGDVDLDSDGNPVDARITKSSGAPALDAYVREWYGSHKFKPATFRCTGVVSTFYFEVTYGE